MRLRTAIAFWIGALIILAIATAAGLGEVIPRDAQIALLAVAAVGFYAFTTRRKRL